MRPALVALLAFASLAACAYVDPDPLWAERRARVAEAQAFTLSTRELRGIDPPAPADRVAKGDRILYGIEFEKGGSRRNWLVHVEVDDPEFQPRQRRDGSTYCMLRLAVRVCDEAGAEVGRDLVTVSRRDLVAGLFRACHEQPQAPAADASLGSRWSAEAAAGGSWQLPADVAAGLALANMLAVIRKSKVLFDVLWTVIDKPSVFSVIFNLGVSVSVLEDFTKAQRLAPVTIDDQEFEVYELPVELQLNGLPALRSKVLLTEPKSPLNLSAGILGIDAFQPSDPAVRVSIRVLAARRAPDGPP